MHKDTEMTQKTQIQDCCPKLPNRNVVPLRQWQFIHLQVLIQSVPSRFNLIQCVTFIATMCCVVWLHVWSRNHFFQPEALSFAKWRSFTMGLLLRSLARDLGFCPRIKQNERLDSLLWSRAQQTEGKPNADLMVGQRRRRWPAIILRLLQCRVSNTRRSVTFDSISRIFLLHFPANNRR